VEKPARPLGQKRKRQDVENENSGQKADKESAESANIDYR
jgi:hypothetical protein